MVDSLPERPLVAGRYALDRRIDTGELGSLWWATDRVTGRSCLLCLVDVPPRGPDEPVRCSGREALALAQVQCGQLVRMVEYGEWQGMPFFVLGLDEPDPAEAGPDPSAELAGRHVGFPSSRREWVPVERLMTPVTLADDCPPSTCRAVVSGSGGADSMPSSATVEAEQTMRSAAPTRPKRASWKTAVVAVSLLVVAILVVAKLGGTSSTANPAAADARDLGRVPSAASSLGRVTPVVSASSSAETARAPASPDRSPPVRAKGAPWSRPRAPRPRRDVPDFGI